MNASETTLPEESLEPLGYLPITVDPKPLPQPGHLTDTPTNVEPNYSPTHGTFPPLISSRMLESPIPGSPFDAHHSALLTLC
jgi:hypothetical protein